MIENQLQLKGSKIFITGATSGIGKCLTETLCKLGAEVVVSGRNPIILDQLSHVKGVIGSVSLDLENLETLDQNLKDIFTKYAPFDGLFHAAGAELIRPLKINKPTDTLKLLNTSIVAGIQLAKAFSSKNNTTGKMQSFVMMSSVAGHVGKAGLSAYSASKGAIDAAVKSLACELATRNIRVNSIAAGAVETEMHQRIIQNLDENSIKAYESEHLLGFGKPIDVANAACFLLSPLSNWITGTTMVVDGGYICH
jgi:NAD(P)-dependent dehydrogenase (short-subunit alcohol dehydrogenase family)